MSTLFRCICCLIFSLSSLHAQHYADTLSHRINDIVASSDLKGVGVAIVSKDQILYQNGFGYADVQQQTPYTPQTLHNIGSISKTLIAFALMKCVEKGWLELDDDINKYLPFKVSHPKFPQESITVRMLATHTSSLTDGAEEMLIERSYLLQHPTNFSAADLPEGYHELYQLYNQNTAMSMGQFLRRVYSPEGDWYETANFLEAAPGTTYHYSNLGATLLAFLIEQVSQQSFDQFTQQILLRPLSMDQSTWHLDRADTSHFASLYLSNGQQVPPYQLITYPDGGLITSVADFSRYLMEMIKGMNGESQLLRTTSYQTMMSNQLTTTHFPKGDFDKSRGLIWTVNSEGDNIGMNGADPGIATYTLFTTAGNLGIVLFTNMNLYGNEAVERDFIRIRNTLLQFAGKLRPKP